MSEFDLFTLVLPVLAPVLAGWLAVRAKVMESHDARALTSAFLHIFLPALIVGHLATEKLAALFNVPFILATVSLMLGIYLAMLAIHRLLLRRTPAESALAAFAAAKFNAVVVGIPLLLIAIGQKAIVAAVINMVIGYFTILPLTLFLLEMAKAGKEGQAARYSLVIAKALRHVVCDPLVVSTLVGLVLAALQVNLPKWVSQSLTVIGSAGIAVPLVAVGMTIGGSKLKHSEGEVAWVSAVRLVVSPLLAIVAARVFALPPVYAIALVISFSLPTAKMAFAMAEEHGEYESQMAAIVTVTTIAMVVAFPGFLWVCEHLWPGVIARPK